MRAAVEFLFTYIASASLTTAILGMLKLFVLLNLEWWHVFFPAMFCLASLVAVFAISIIDALRGSK